MVSKNLCIIPARGGSKRIPRKNIKSFMGKPIIAYSIEAALKTNLFKEVMVSTDDTEIAEIARKHGAVVPFLRSSENADDFATTADVLLEVLREYRALGEKFENVCCIYPTAPFVTEVKLIDAHEKLLAENLNAVFPVVPFGYPIQRALKIQQEKLQFFFPEFEESRSQDLEKAYHDAGQFYFVRTRSLLESGTILSDNTGSIIITEMETQDIDNPIDWDLAEVKFKMSFEK
ncbi:pseudaminic acid cytidylyltransferase [Salinimicrobium sp. TH3]|uniref:pseudaminic acid cytidylyltransferase n=1 Tax=Salinimicrobium sp. TH3 TaxID=2997342 RepID=UPI002276CCCE|nr:pseudaminic acid cytidylyltransferase [Salinimicrobium sp. TH3]MCY2686953.1 pseudaminic acid cytidylyltransferase [Salinimicrobium sp. TH3]